MRRHHYTFQRLRVFAILTMAMDCLTLLGADVGVKTQSHDNGADAEATALVERALTAEVSADAEQRNRLLEQATLKAPRFAPARWHSGQIQVRGKWLTVDEVQQSAQQNKALAEYRQHRASQNFPTLDGELELALWCNKNNLTTEARAHWFRVLEFDPDNALALKQLGLFRYQAAFVTRSEMLARKKEATHLKLAFDLWRPKLATWRRELDDKDQAKRQAVIEKIRAIDDSAVVPAFEQLLLTKDEHNKLSSVFGVEMVHALAKLHGQRVSEALVRQAALSAWPETRQAAIHELKSYDLIEYVPFALANMSAPLKIQHQINQVPSGTVFYEECVWRDGPEVDDCAIHRAIFEPKVVFNGGGRDSGGKSKSDADRIIERNREAQESREAQSRAEHDARKAAESRAAERQRAIENINQVAVQQNEGIRHLLTETTGEDHGTGANAWWDWWIKYNELHYPPFHPVRINSSESYHVISVASRSKCCFAAGTKVCTSTGMTPIEKILPGDQVLAQDAQTGELAFRVVLAASVRPPDVMRKIQVNGNAITATSGHRFWVVGHGWKMAKHLEADSKLHGVAGALVVDSIEELPADEAYSLTVDDFHTYFVGDSQVLVHDNSAPKPIQGPVPGLSKSGQ